MQRYKVLKKDELMKTIFLRQECNAKKLMKLNFLFYVYIYI